MIFTLNDKINDEYSELQTLYTNRDRYQEYEIPKFPFYMREWREAFMDIDEK